MGSKGLFGVEATTLRDCSRRHGGTPRRQRYIQVDFGSFLLDRPASKCSRVCETLSKLYAGRGGTSFKVTQRGVKGNQTNEVLHSDFLTMTKANDESKYILLLKDDMSGF